MLANLPVRYKVTAIAVITTTIVLVLASALFVALEINNYRRALVQELTAIAQITSSNSTAAILFNDAFAAQETLAALGARPNIESAALYKRTGKEFARFGGQVGRPEWIDGLAPNVHALPAGGDNAIFSLSWSPVSVDLYGAVRFEEETIGAIYIRSSLAQIYATIETYLIVVLVIIAIAVFLAWMLAVRLQKQVTSPIHELLATMQSVARDRNYSLRAKRYGNDELGALVDGFNNMLAETEAHKSELNAARYEAESASRMKSEFLAHMSHELRTPLNAILGFSDFMMSEPLGPLGHDNYREYTQGIQVGGNHLLGVINNILDLSKLESGSAKLNEELVDIAQVIEECVQMLAERAATGEIDLRVETMGELPQLCGDAHLLKRSLLNLLSNSIKFTPAGGEIVVHAAAKPQGDFVLTVTDTGIGIAPEQISHVLTPFGQAENVFRRSHEGTGLGLPLVKSFVEMHDGKLDLKSSVGQGTHVTIRLPASRVHEKLAQKVAGGAEATRQNNPSGLVAPASGQTAERRNKSAAALPV